MMNARNILILGCGYVGKHIASACVNKGMQVIALNRTAEQKTISGIKYITASDLAQIPDEILRDVDAVLDSIPLQHTDTGLHASQPRWLPQIAAKLKHIRWAGYLSSISVYGDTAGAWVDESSVCTPSSIRGKERLVAESAWLDSVLPVEIFRLAGIYGPERNMIPKLMRGNYKVVQWSPPHASHRIHVDDIVAAIMAAMARPKQGRIVNLSDDTPMPHADYATELARLCGAPPPILLTPENAGAQLPSAALDFFRDDKKISNQRLHKELLPELRHPSFQSAVSTLS